MTRRAALLCSSMLVALPAWANDSVAELGTGGIVLAQSDNIEMARETLFISKAQVKVDYLFRNTSDADVQSLVAFPMPDISASPYELDALPSHAGDNFLDFSVIAGGKVLQPALDQRASAVGVDITDELRKRNVPLFPFSEGTRRAVQKLPSDITQDWLQRGILIPSTAEDGETEVLEPFWSLHSAYWWRATFPAKSDVQVSHTYKPSVGGTSGLNFFYDGQFHYDGNDYKRRYCIDKAFEDAVRRVETAAKEGTTPFFETRLRYVLTSGENWANGRIGSFRLVVDKGAPGNLVSFCGNGVRKIGPTTFEMTATDFAPLEDIDILILEPYKEENGG